MTTQVEVRRSINRTLAVIDGGLNTATGVQTNSATPKPKLLDQARQAIRMRHYSPRTEDSYIHWIKRFIFFHKKRHPAEMAEPEIARFLSNLAAESKVSGSTQNQALNALLFLYHQVLKKEIGYVNGVVRAKKVQRLPVVLTRAEIQSLLNQFTGTEKIMATLLYGAGLRLMECCRLRVKDIDFSQNQIVIRAGKGDKDRYTMLPTAVKEPLMKHLDDGKRQHRYDVEKNLGRVVLPNALDRKYPNANREWAWQWVFPATRYYIDRHTGLQYRHHLHESVLQKAVREAVRNAGIPKPATCHSLRHSFATHLLEDGYDIRTAEEIVEENDFGHLIVKDKQGKYWRISPEELSCEVLAKNREELDALSVDQNFVHDWYMRPLVEQAKERIGTLLEGRKYCFKIQTVFGGEYSRENLATLSLIELIRVSGDLAKQIKDQPDGTQVRLKIVE